MEKLFKSVLGAVMGLVVAAGLGAFVFFSFTPSGVAIINSYFHNIQKVDDSTRYETKKKVEDSCRAMISSYEADKLVYEQYKGSVNAEKQSWAEQAKMRANKTASSYNNFILKNSYVWEDNIPEDIKEQLEVIE